MLVTGERGGGFRCAALRGQDHHSYSAHCPRRSSATRGAVVCRSDGGYDARKARGAPQDRLDPFPGALPEPRGKPSCCAAFTWWISCTHCSSTRTVLCIPTSMPGTSSFPPWQGDAHIIALGAAASLPMAFLNGLRPSFLFPSSGMAWGEGAAPTTPSIALYTCSSFLLRQHGTHCVLVSLSLCPPLSSASQPPCRGLLHSLRGKVMRTSLLKARQPLCQWLFSMACGLASCSLPLGWSRGEGAAPTYTLHRSIHCLHSSPGSLSHISFSI